MREFGSLEIQNKAGETLCTYSAQDAFSHDGICVSVSDAAHTLRVNAYLSEAYFANALQALYAFVAFGLLAVFGLGVFMAWIAAWQQALPMRRLIEMCIRDSP